MRFSLGKKLTLSAVLVGSLALTAQAQDTQSNKITVNICGGGPSGTYIKVAKYFKYMLTASGGDKYFDVNVFETFGSRDNIELMSQGTCDISILQADAEDWYRRRAHMDPLALRTVSQVYDEHAHLLCHRSLGIYEIGDLAKVAKSSSRGVVYTGSDYSGGAMTMENLLNIRKDEFSKVVSQLNDGDKNLKLDAMQNSIELAVKDRACAFFVARAPYKYLVDDEISLSRELVLVELNDRKYWEVKSQAGSPIYTSVDFASVDSEEPYLGYRQKTPNNTFKGNRNLQTLALAATIVVNQEWESNMKDALINRGLTGTMQRWVRVLQLVQKFNGNFSQIESQLSRIESAPAPRKE